MWMGGLDVWEAIGVIFRFLSFGLLVYMVWLLRTARRELREFNARAKEDREEFKAQLDRERDAFKAQLDRERDAFMAQLDCQRAESYAGADRDRAESKAQANEDRALYMHENAKLSKADAEQSKSTAAVQGDAHVLLDRSDGSSGSKVGTDDPDTRYEIARQAIPAPREEDGGEDESR